MTSLYNDFNVYMTSSLCIKTISTAIEKYQAMYNVGNFMLFYEKINHASFVFWDEKLQRCLYVAYKRMSFVIKNKGKISI